MTVGSVALIFLAAVEALAVTTVMPVVSADLDGASLYAVAFSGTLAAGVVGMVVTGAWCDRAQPVVPLTVAVGLFVLGLIIAGFATSMPAMVAGRLVQGLGTGGQTVALYVVVARVYPPQLHGRVFAAFAAAWVLPSLVGPFLAGAVAQYLHWRWVFLGVAILTVIAYAMVLVRLGGRDLRAGSASGEPVLRRVVCAVVVAGAALCVGLAADAGPWAWVIVAACAVVLAVAIRPLLPRGTLHARAGLPSVVMMRGLIAGALFGAEVYIPYLLVERHGFTPVFAGLGLTTAALAWAGASAVQGRYGDVIGNRRISIAGTALLTSSTLVVLLCATLGLSPVVLIAGWTLAGIGMGLMYSRLTVLTLAYSTTENQGFSSAALSIFDSVGAATAIASMGVVFTALTATDAAFPAVFAIAAVLAAAALWPGLRLGHAAERMPTSTRLG